MVNPALETTDENNNELIPIIVPASCGSGPACTEAEFPQGGILLFLLDYKQE